MTLEARGLQKRFSDRGRGTVLAVDQVDLDVRPGEVFGLLGPNGAGKTTTLRLLTTLLRPDAGTIHIAGVDALADPVGARAKLAYVPAEAGLPRRVSPLEVVTLFGRVQGVAQAEERARDLLRSLGAEGFQHAPCDGLSTGMKRRVVLARALIHDPPVLLLDEPTDGLDVPGRRDVLDLVRRLAQDGRAVLLCSHIMSEVELTCTRAAIMARGRLAASGTLEELRTSAGTHDLSEAFVRLTQAPA